MLERPSEVPVESCVYNGWHQWLTRHGIVTNGTGAEVVRGTFKRLPLSAGLSTHSPFKVNCGR